jgi:hypothetical protein
LAIGKSAVVVLPAVTVTTLVLASPDGRVAVIV